MDDVKKCSKCKSEKLLMKFHKNKLTKDGQNSICKNCMKEYYLNNAIKLIQKQEDYYLKIHNRTKHCKMKIEKINEYNKKYKKQRRF